MPLRRALRAALIYAVGIGLTAIIWVAFSGLRRRYLPEAFGPFGHVAIIWLSTWAMLRLVYGDPARTNPEPPEPE